MLIHLPLYWECRAHKLIHLLLYSECRAYMHLHLLHLHLLFCWEGRAHMHIQHLLLCGGVLDLPRFVFSMWSMFSAMLKAKGKKGQLRASLCDALRGAFGRQHDGGGSSAHCVGRRLVRRIRRRRPASADRRAAESILQWIRRVYVECHPSESPSCFTYMANAMDLHRRLCVAPL